MTVNGSYEATVTAAQNAVAQSVREGGRAGDADRLIVVLDHVDHRAEARHHDLARRLEELQRPAESKWLGGRVASRDVILLLALGNVGQITALLSGGLG